jgi:hypothetical protein
MGSLRTTLGQKGSALVLSKPTMTQQNGIRITNRCSCRLGLRAESGAYASVITSAAWLRAAAQLNSMLDAHDFSSSGPRSKPWSLFNGSWPNPLRYFLTRG